MRRPAVSSLWAPDPDRAGGVCKQSPDGPPPWTQVLTRSLGAARGIATDRRRRKCCRGAQRAWSQLVKPLLPAGPRPATPAQADAVLGVTALPPLQVSKKEPGGSSPPGCPAAPAPSSPAFWQNWGLSASGTAGATPSIRKPPAGQQSSAWRVPTGEPGSHGVGLYVLSDWGGIAGPPLPLPLSGTLTSSPYLRIGTSGLPGAKC